MTVTTIYTPAEADSLGYVFSGTSTWANVIAQSTGSSASVNAANIYAIASMSGSLYFVSQAFMRFDVSTITDTVDSVTLTTRAHNTVGTDSYGYSLREFDWGTTLTTADLCSRTELLALTELATAPRGIEDQYQQWTSASAFKTAVENGTTLRLIVANTHQIDNVAPTTENQQGFYGGAANIHLYLTVTHSTTVTGTAAAGFTSTTTALGTVIPGTTPVSREVEADWDVDTLSGVQDVAAVWAVDVYTDAASVVAEWDVTALTGVREVVGVWNVDMLTGVQPVEAQWDLEGKVSGEIQAIWDTDGRVSASSEALWELEAYVLTALDVAWDVTIDTGFVEVAAEWELDELVASETAAQWDLDGSVGSALAAVWDVDMIMSSPSRVIARWDTQIDIPADNTMTYYFMDAANGEILGDLPFTDVSMSWVLSGSGTFEGSLKLSDPEIILRGGRNIRPGRTAIVADRGGIPIWSGIVWSKQFTGADSTVRITAGDFWTYIKRRLVFTNYSQKFTDVLWAAEDLIKMAVDPGVGGPERLTYQLSKPITVTDRPITLKYAITDMINIGEAIEGLAEAPGDTGIDFICKQYWVDEDVLIPFIKIGRPYVGRTYEETGTEFSFPGSVISYEETVDASALSNRIIAKGTDDGAKTKYTVITRDDQLEVYPRYDSAISVDNKNLSVIESTAEYVSRRRAAPTRIATVTVRADLDPSPLDMEIGDWFLLRLEDAQSGDPQERMYRVGGMTYNPTDQTVEISPWVETDEYE